MSAIGNAVKDLGSDLGGAVKDLGSAVEGVATLNPGEALSGITGALGSAAALTPEGAAATLLEGGVQEVLGGGSGG
ncbi:hypothetical protein [Burkholderia sp. WAC0059]|uniref:hypothetical protein n=1 Tax=Burkholderia sp. WAC0059 TaxID=2066022 RepID=UPI0011AEC492|nr:hypothetical protein [Burkholderia sp. WAC0059]